MSRQGGLGRGLDALIPTATEGRSGLLTLRLGAIVPNRRQPREDFDEQGLEELAQSLRQLGMLQPVLVRPVEDGKYELIAGERRYRAAQIAGLEEIPALVRATDDSDLLTEALVENIHRVDLNPLEEAAGMQQLLDDFGLTHDELADRIGKSRPSITNTLRLLSLGPELQKRVATGALRPGHARALLAIKDENEQERIAQRVVAEGLSVRATEELARKGAAGSARTKPDSGDGTGERSGGRGSDEANRRGGSRGRSSLPHLEEALSDALATQVRIEGSADRGRIVVDYAGSEDLERLLAILGARTGEELGHEQP
ncbi:ParB/RepB/Spo0J family partition protein [Egibacter rhizosphaerae]|uniref:ParB/RepB/Spo0J family partition protein n=1 Tax=Egibacter rhizosphaerae TaxID=1670831 RepID=A0A411YFU7_9ACTN|nr:ParB/RepB/Spo0J family partition protein [Egibacter rhizosphaerae]QBI20007.1 ParB/RepB/Spo0J family partition protein [Egibacter rhizosphaerae]